MDNDDYYKWHPVVARVARRIAYKWPNTDVEDAEQEAWVKIVENEKGILKTPEDEQEALVAGLARLGAQAYAIRERHYYQSQTAEWIYTPDEVRLLLGKFFDEGSWRQPVKRPEGANQTLMGDGVVIGLMDIRRAYESLSESDQTIIIRVYDAAERLGDAKDRVRLQRAVDRIVTFLNRKVVPHREVTQYELV